MPTHPRLNGFVYRLRLCIELVICLALLLLVAPSLTSWPQKMPAQTNTTKIPELLDVFRRPSSDMPEHRLILLHRNIIYTVAALTALHHLGYLFCGLEPTQVFFRWLQVYLKRLIPRNKHAIETERLQIHLRREQLSFELQRQSMAVLREYYHSLHAAKRLERADMDPAAHRYSEFEWSIPAHATGLLGSLIRPCVGSVPTSCVICFIDYVIGDMVRKLPCGHLFHAECCETWLKKSFTCPLCQRGLCWKMEVRFEDL